jgi:hypothetical protein
MLEWCTARHRDGALGGRTDERSRNAWIARALVSVAAAPIHLPQSFVPAFSMEPCEPDHADALLARWKHPLGPCGRPFGRQDWLMAIDGQPVAVCVSASTVSATAAGYGRGELVELARIARHPDHRYVLRVALRLWRVYLAERWPYWSVAAAVSYAMPGTRGDIYRFDGWERVGVVKPSGGSGTWTRARPRVNDIGDGKKTLWRYRYDAALNQKQEGGVSTPP